MKVKTTVKAGLIVGIGNVVGSGGSGNTTIAGGTIGNSQTGSGTQINVL